MKTSGLPNVNQIRITNVVLEHYEVTAQAPCGYGKLGRVDRNRKNKLTLWKTNRNFAFVTLRKPLIGTSHLIVVDRRSDTPRRAH